MKLIKEALTLAIELYLESGDEIPEPINEDDYKGNIAYRTTPRRHYLIAQQAQKKRMSLSRFIDNLIDTTLELTNKSKKS